MSDEQPNKTAWRDVASIVCFAGTIVFGVGGTLIVRSEAGSGTTVTGTVPVDRSGLADET